MKGANVTAVEPANLDQEKQQKVLLAAKERFSRFGFRKTTVDEIAEAAGMSKRTVYQVFDSKETILADLVMSEARSFRKLLTGRMKQLSDPADKLRLLCDLSTHYFDENPFLGQVLFDDARLYEPFLGNEIHMVEDGMRDLIANLLREGVRQGAFREMDVKATTLCVFVLFRGFTYRKTDLQNGNKEWVPFILRAIEMQ